MEAAMPESVYDKEIAPLLLKAGQLCQQHGMSIVCMVEYEPGSFGRTTALTKDRHIGVSMADLAVRSEGNADALIGAMLKHARQNGHNSIYLLQLLRLEKEYDNAQA
jgi:hypothetical protein